METNVFASGPPLVTGSNQKVKTALMTDKSARANSKSQREGAGKHRKWRECGIFSGSNSQQFFSFLFSFSSIPFNHSDSPPFTK